MLENRVVRYSLYAASFCITSELAYRAYLAIRNAWQRYRDASDEIAEAIWTNELSQTCAGQHRSKSVASPKAGTSAEAATSSSSTSGNGRIVKSPSKGDSAMCSNPYCRVYNMDRLVELINQCKYSIDLAMYTFTSYGLQDAFMNAKRRGVVVRIITDEQMGTSSGSRIESFLRECNSGISVRWPETTMLMHHKFCILDGSKRVETVLAEADKTRVTKSVRSVLMTGSLNWTVQGFNGNWENILITSNKALVKCFEDEFERMWIAFQPREDKAKGSANNNIKN